MNSTITFHAAAMQRALAFSAQITERCNTIPVLGNILIDASDNTIKVYSTDLDIEGRFEFEAAKPTTQPVKFTISPRRFGHFVRYAEGQITMKIAESKQGRIATIEADGATMEARLFIPAEDFPFMPSAATGKGITTSEAVIRRTLAAVKGSISTEETRYCLNGAYLHPRDRQLVAVATDDHRLSKYEPKIDWHLEPMIMPTKIVNFLIRNFGKDTNRQVNIWQHGNRIEVDGDGWTIKAKTIDGTFPDYTRVIPKPSDEIQVALSLAMLKRIPPSDQRSTAVKIDPANGKMTAEAYDEGTFTIPITGKGGPIGFNLKYLLSFAQQFGTIQLTGKGKGDPALVHVEDPAFTGVIMPMRV
jgi:DNA polymerase-3 subunit beta